MSDFKCSVASGAVIVLSGTTDDDLLTVTYDFGKNVFTADTEAGRARHGKATTPPSTRAHAPVTLP